MKKKVSDNTYAIANFYGVVLVPHTGGQELGTWLGSSRGRRRARLRLSMVSRDAEEAKTRLLEKPGGPKAKESHEGKAIL